MFLLMKIVNQNRLVGQALLVIHYLTLYIKFSIIMSGELKDRGL